MCIYSFEVLDSKLSVRHHMCRRIFESARIVTVLLSISETKSCLKSDKTRANERCPCLRNDKVPRSSNTVYYIMVITTRASTLLLSIDIGKNQTHLVSLYPSVTNYVLTERIIHLPGTGTASAVAPAAELGSSRYSAADQSWGCVISGPAPRTLRHGPHWCSDRASPDPDHQTDPWSGTVSLSDSDAANVCSYKGAPTN